MDIFKKYRFWLATVSFMWLLVRIYTFWHMFIKVFSLATIKLLKTLWENILYSMRYRCDEIFRILDAHLYICMTPTIPCIGYGLICVNTIHSNNVSINWNNTQLLYLDLGQFMLVFNHYNKTKELNYSICWNNSEA